MEPAETFKNPVILLKESEVVAASDRAFVLDALKSVDYTVIFEEDTPEELIACLKPSIHVKGGDYKKEDLPETKIVESYGGEVIILNFVEGKSTTNIIEKINKK